MIIFLWNRERILKEGLELTKLKISRALGFDKNVVEGNYTIHEGKLVPDLQINEEHIPDDYKASIGDIIKNTWVEVYQGMAEKIASL